MHIGGITEKSNGPWMEQVARNLTDGIDGFLRDYEYLIHDRDPLFTPSYLNILKAERVESVRLPRKSPSLNADCERFIRSIKHECLGGLLNYYSRQAA